MLILTRKKNERITIEGPCEILISQIGGGKVKLGIIADDSVKILRTELTRHGTSKPGKAAEAADADADAETARIRAANEATRKELLAKAD